MSGWDVYTIVDIAAASALTLNSMNGYRPLQWTIQGLTNTPDQLVYLYTNINGYFFDAVIRSEHVDTRRITEHPVQNGADITDHSFQLPATVMMELGMSDAMDSFVPGQFGNPSGFNVGLLNPLSVIQGAINNITGNNQSPTKSVNAYKTLKQLQASGLPVTIMTRLDRYTNMLIESVTALESAETVAGGRFLVNFKQILIAQVATTASTNSSKPQTTGSTPMSPVQAETPSGSVASQATSAITGGK